MNARRKFLKRAVQAAGLTSLTPLVSWWPFPSRRSASMTLSVGLGGVFASDPVFHHHLRGFFQRVGHLSGGSLGFQPRFLPSGSSPLATAREGSLDLVISSSTYGSPLIRTFFGSLYPAISGDHQAWMRSERGFALWRELYAREGLHAIGFGTSAGLYGQLMSGKARAAEEAAGLRALVSTSERHDWLRGMGLESTLASNTRSLFAADSRKLDVLEPLQPSFIRGTKLHAQSGFHYVVGDWDKSSYNIEMLSLVKNWERLPAEIRAVLERAAAEESVLLTAALKQREQEALRRIAAESAVAEISTDHPFRREITARKELWLDRWAERDSLAATLLEARRRSSRSLA
ncbi:MAG: hypothetical protein KF865_02510 [Bdellovibrionaceae bacterium]|nr:hypothetical protein [Pseudobdellovibrionaceae bacterium]